MAVELRRVAVTGIGAITSIGNTATEFWKNLEKGVSGAGEITHFDASKFKTKFACEVKGFNPEDYMDRKEARKIDPFVQFALVAAREALSDSELQLEKDNLYRAGVIWGSGVGGLSSYYSELLEYSKGDGTPRFSPFFVLKLIVNMAAGHIAMEHGFKGPSYATVSACASSTHAIIDAATKIRLGKADVMITGGSEATITESCVGGFNSLKALSTRNDDPATASRPFDIGRDGFVIGEGAGALILEEYEHAVRRGAKIYAEFVGEGTSCDAYHVTAPNPEGEGAVSSMSLALEDAGISPDMIDYINLHGTSTSLGDKSEAIAVTKVFKDSLDTLNVSSTKSMTGHLLGGAGGVEAVASILAINHGVVPPTINHFTDDPEIPALNYTFNLAQKKQLRYVMSNTFGFGGQNASIIFKNPLL